MLPKVIIYNYISLDGRINGFNSDKKFYYQLASQWNLDAVLMGTDTLLRNFNIKYDKLNETENFEFSEVDEDDSRPLLVVPDSRGRIRAWNRVFEMGLFRDILVLCSNRLLKNI